MDDFVIDRIVQRHAIGWSVDSIARAMYLTNAQVQSVVNLIDGNLPLPKEPTQAPAGTREKIEVLRERVVRGEQLWHPDDRADYAGCVGGRLKRMSRLWG